MLVQHSRGTLVSRTCARAVAAPRGKACRVTAKVLRGSFGAIQEQSIQAKKTRPRREELSGKATQGTRPRREELAGKANQGISRNLPRRATRPDKARRAAGSRTRQRPRQGTCRGKLPLCTRAPAHPPTCHPGTLPGVRGGRLCSQRYAVASGADKIAIVA